jgi:hypothetical protein
MNGSWERPSAQAAWEILTFQWIKLSLKPPIAPGTFAAE